MFEPTHCHTLYPKTFWYLRGNSIDDIHAFSIAREDWGTKGGLRGPRWSFGSPRWFLSAFNFPLGKYKSIFF